MARAMLKVSTYTIKMRYSIGIDIGDLAISGI